MDIANRSIASGHLEVLLRAGAPCFELLPTGELIYVGTRTGLTPSADRGFLFRNPEDASLPYFQARLDGNVLTPEERAHDAVSQMRLKHKGKEVTVAAPAGPVHGHRYAADGDALRQLTVVREPEQIFTGYVEDETLYFDHHQFPWAADTIKGSVMHAGRKLKVRDTDPKEDRDAYFRAMRGAPFTAENGVLRPLLEGPNVRRIIGMLLQNLEQNILLPRHPRTDAQAQVDFLFEAYGGFFPDILNEIREGEHHRRFIPYLKHLFTSPSDYGFAGPKGVHRLLPIEGTQYTAQMLKGLFSFSSFDVQQWDAEEFRKNSGRQLRAFIQSVPQIAASTGLLARCNDLSRHLLRHQAAVQEPDRWGEALQGFTGVFEGDLSFLTSPTGKPLALVPQMPGIAAAAPKEQGPFSELLESANGLWALYRRPAIHALVGSEELDAAAGFMEDMRLLTDGLKGKDLRLLLRHMRQMPYSLPGTTYEELAQKLQQARQPERVFTEVLLRSARELQNEFLDSRGNIETARVKPLAKAQRTKLEEALQGIGRALPPSGEIADYVGPLQVQFHSLAGLLRETHHLLANGGMREGPYSVEEMYESHLPLLRAIAEGISKVPLEGIRAASQDALFLGAIYGIDASAVREGYERFRESLTADPVQRVDERLAELRMALKQAYRSFAGSTPLIEQRSELEEVVRHWDARIDKFTFAALSTETSAPMAEKTYAGLLAQDNASRLGLVQAGTFIAGELQQLKEVYGLPVRDVVLTVINAHLERTGRYIGTVVR